MKNILDRYGHDSTRFGGLIYSHDFNTNFNASTIDAGYDSNQGSEIAIRIEQDFRFDELCRRKLKEKPCKNDTFIHPWRRGHL